MAVQRRVLAREREEGFIQNAIQNIQKFLWFNAGS